MKRNNKEENKTRNLLALLSFFILLFTFLRAENEKIEETVQEEDIASASIEVTTETEREDNETSIVGNVYKMGIMVMPIEKQKPMLEEANLEPETVYVAKASENNNLFEEEFLLQQITFAEAGFNQPDDAVVGIVNVILNRKEDERFPDTINDVVFDQSYGVKQFSPTNDGKIYFYDWKDQDTYEYRTVEKTDITEQVRTSVEKALNGENTVGKRKYFYVPKWCSDEELAKRANITDAIQIGDIVFYGED